MKAILENGTVRASCPDCGVLTSFESVFRGAQHGFIFIPPKMRAHVAEVPGRMFQLLRCASCGRGGLAEIRVYTERPDVNGTLVAFGH